MRSDGLPGVLALSEACKITDKQVENRILEAIPNQIADQVVVGLVGNETKADLMAKIKDYMVKKRSVFFI